MERDSKRGGRLLIGMFLLFFGLIIDVLAYNRIQQVNEIVPLTGMTSQLQDYYNWGLFSLIIGILFTVAGLGFLFLAGSASSASNAEETPRFAMHPEKSDSIDSLNDKEKEIARQLIKELKTKARRKGFVIQTTPSGLLLLPVVKGRVLSEEEMLALPERVRDEIQEARKKLEIEFRNIIKHGVQEYDAARLKGIVEMTPEGPVITNAKRLKHYEAIALILYMLENKTGTDSQIENRLKASGIKSMVSARLNEMTRRGLVFKPTPSRHWEFKLTTNGERWIESSVLPKIGGVEPKELIM